MLLLSFEAAFDTFCLSYDPALKPNNSNRNSKLNMLNAYNYYDSP